MHTCYMGGLVCALVLLLLCVFELEERKQTNLLGALFRKLKTLMTCFSMNVSLNEIILPLPELWRLNRQPSNLIGPIARIYVASR